MAKHTILGLGILCDHGCVIVLTAEKSYVMHNNKLLLSGTRKKGHLWYLNPQDSRKAPTVNGLITSDQQQSTPTPSYLDEPMINSITSVYQSKRLKDAMQFHHAAFNNCSKITLLTSASKEILPLWLLLTRKNISTYISETRATHMGHMQRIRQKIRSKKQQIPFYLQNLETEGIDIVQEAKCEEVYIQILDVTRMNVKVYTDLTGAFPTTSARGNKYIYIAYSYDANGILFETMKSKHNSEMLRVFDKVYRKLTSRGIKPTFHVMNNEASSTIMDWMQRVKQVDAQKVSPHNHRANVSERMIETGKHHLISEIAVTDENFPITQWDRLIPKTQRKINMMRPCRINPKLSADAFLEGQHDYNAVPFPPLGRRMLTFEGPDQKSSWGFHAVEG